MEINITHLVDDRDSMVEFSASIAEIGQNAARYTWGNAVESATEQPLLTTNDQVQSAIQFLDEFGAWDDLDQWPHSEVNALVLQFIAGDIREMEAYDSFDEYQAASEAGQVDGRIWYSEADGTWWYYLGT